MFFDSDPPIANIELVLHVNVQLSLSCAFSANAHLFLKHSSVRQVLNSLFYNNKNAIARLHMRWDRKAQAQTHAQKQPEQLKRKSYGALAEAQAQTQAQAHEQRAQEQAQEKRASARAR